MPIYRVQGQGVLHNFLQETAAWARTSARMNLNESKSLPWLHEYCKNEFPSIQVKNKNTKQKETKQKKIRQNKIEINY